MTLKVEDLGSCGTLLDKQKSSTTEAVYEIRWNKATGYHCDCQGWQASRSKPRVCRHIKRYCFKYQLEQLFHGTEYTPETILKLAIDNWKGEI